LDGSALYEDLKALGINLISNVIWFVAGLVSGVVLSSGRGLARPRFWSQMMRDKVALVVGAHGDFDSYEASGMIGTGDALALAEFIAYFKANKFDDYEVVSARTIDASLLNRNLVLIGGADANATSRDFIERTQAARKIRFGDPDRQIVSFEFEGEMYSPSREKAMDAAAIVFHRSPYSEDGRVLLVAGCYGHGTLAAAQLLCRSKSFAGKARWLERFEAAITCEVVKHGPTATELQRLA